MKRERLTRIVLVIVGLLNVAIIYFLYTDLRHSSWLLVQKNETEPMFLSFFIPVRGLSPHGRKETISASLDDCSNSLVEHLPWHGDGDSNRGSLESRRPQELY
jgi:hypothetical protein